jgi:hypothetical protein
MSMLRKAIFFIAEDGLTLIFISKQNVLHDAFPFLEVFVLGFCDEYSTEK